MGYKDKSYKKTLHQQAYEKLTSMQAFGESKREAIESGTDKGKIFSYNTYKTYWKHTKYFLHWIQENHPEVTNLKGARKYVNEWLQGRVDQVDKDGKHLSAWTIQTEAKALGKLYGISQGDPDYFDPPKRRREDIKRSRSDVKMDKHFSVTNNDEYIKFCKGTGCRVNVIRRLERDDLWTRDRLEKASSGNDIMREALELFPTAAHFVHHRSDKGGRERFAPVIGPNERQIVERFENTLPGEKVWQHVPLNADTHSYRAEYATAIYKSCARPIDKIPYDKINKGSGRKYQSDVYHCKSDEKGKKLDRAAMLKASKALGHNRVEVVANNYIRGL